ncbi:MAG: PIG-L deacetylase family protein [Anaerolineae bacterium]
MLSQRESLLAIFAHPDDEVFRCGGTLALLAQRGVRAQVLTATRGQAGSLGDHPLCSRQELGTVREAELRCACRALGIPPPLLLEYQDGTLAQVDEDKAVSQVMAVVHEMQPHAILTMPAHGLSGHPDHIAVSRWANLAFGRATSEGRAFPVAIYHLAVPRLVADQLGFDQLRATPDNEIDVTVDVSTVWDAKIAAIHCHRTQSEVRILRAPHERQLLFLGKEHFQRVAARPGHDPLASWLGRDG